MMRTPTRNSTRGIGDGWNVAGGKASRTRAARELMRRHNPAVIPRNHKVEEALQAATAGDLAVITRLLDAVSAPYDHERDLPEYSAPGGERAYRTFCGT